MFRSDLRRPQRLYTQDYSVIVYRSAARRKTLSFSVDHGAVVVRAPVHTTDEEILHAIERHHSRIERLLQQAVPQQRARPLPWANGKLNVFDYQLDLRFHPAPRWSVRADGHILNVGGPAAGLWDSATVPIVTGWLRKRARDILLDRTELWAKNMGISFGRMTIRDQRSRWGSCSSQGNLNFNWRLVLAPPAVLDYVVVHELCHRLEMNHSKRFWSHVEHWFPDYRAARAWLKTEGRSLYFGGESYVHVSKN